MPLGLDDHPGGRAMTPILRALILRTLDHEAYDASSDRRDRLHAVMLDELVCLPVDQVAITISTEPRLAQVCEMILADPASPLTLASLARDAGMSIRTPSRLARFELGCSMAVWRQQARIMAAVPMLVAGRSVIETAQATGYDTPSAFAAMFRRVVGTTPAAFAGRRTAIGQFKTL